MFSARHLAATLFALGMAWLPIQAEAQNLKVVASAAPLNEPNGVVIDPSGNIYVANGHGPGGISPSIIKIAPDGTASTAYTLPASDGEACLGGLARGPDGTLYVTDGCNARVLHVTAAGIAVTIANRSNGLVSPIGLAFDQSGDLYVSDLDANTITKITPSGTVSNYVPASAGLNGPWGITFDTSGALYVANSGLGALSSGPNAETITKITSSGIAWTVGGLVSEAGRNLGAPFSLASGGPLGSVLIGTNFDIYEIDAGGSLRLPVWLPFNFLSGLNTPYGMAFDSAGNLVVADGATNSLNVTSSGPSLSTVVQSDIAHLGTPAVDGAGNLYVSSFLTQSVLKIAPNGSTTAYATAAQGLHGPLAITLDRGGNLYVADYNPGDVTTPYSVIKVTPTGAASVLAPGVDALAMVADSTGNLFVVGGTATSSGVLKITPQGAVSTFISTETNGQLGYPGALAIDQQDNLYVPGLNNSAIAKVTPAGAISTVLDSSEGLMISSLARSNDGTLYIASYYQQSVLAVGPDGVVSTLAEYAPGQTTPVLVLPAGIAYDNNGGLYISDAWTSSVLRLTLSPSQIAAAVLPGSRSVQLGNTATVFATMINGSGAAQSDCAPALSALAGFDLSMTFQTTNAVTNALTGIANQPVAIPANGTQSFLLSFQSSTALSVSGLPLVFSCQGVTPATTLPGVDTVDLTFSATPVADIIALAATTTKDGTLHLGGGGAAFAIATFDAGASGALTASVDTGSASLPLAASLCQTGSKGQCLSPAAPSIAVNFTANAASTFSVFASATGLIPFAPGASRLFVRFTDSGGVPHGSTSVAVTTN
jgi:sugar lactone lactonase YvrE